ncbi:MULTISPECIES: hypothetical protein [unclassified Streptomyces]|uniref:hypothetical protein n=1 Tax=unclassified Streptomyces TaxID=2593676 RepID=UPI00225A2D9E|nr:MULTISPECIES: hypothetical protein [unclassified Streptomyces]MCX5055180.1 hypothetical protein [Streptomyces sp. NBC_00474]MCX5058688.1 hypothetical protein [Streptomyces sp. NBC_00452]
MHRTTTTATLLVTVAVSALTGCVTVQRPPAPGPPTTPSLPSAPHPADAAEPQIVQAPAREALEMIGPSRRAEPKAPERHVPSATAPAQRPPAPHPPRHSRPRTAHPESGHQRQPRVEIPDASGSVTKGADVCALGRQYGGWRAGSPEAVICEQTYGS